MTKEGKLKIVLWDIETSGIVATTWNLYPDAIMHENLLQDWFIICAAWKVLGENEIKTVSVLDNKGRFKKDHTDDYHVIATLRKALEDVDILIHHNGDKFDVKMFNARLIIHGLPPLPHIVTIDTLKEVRKVAKFTSNRLDFLGKVLTGHGKIETPKGTWLKSMSGNVDAIKTMVEYNKGDVQVLEEVYLKLRPYMKRHPQVGEKQACPNCGSHHTIRRGSRMRATGTKIQENQCNHCGSYFVTVPDKEKNDKQGNKRAEKSDKGSKG